MKSILDMAAELKGSQIAETVQVSFPEPASSFPEPPISPSSTVGQPIPAGPLGNGSVAVNISSNEAEMLMRYRNGQKASEQLDNADKVMGKVPFWGVISGMIGRVIPPGYGTYTSAIVLIFASIASAYGYPIPFIDIPENMTGITGILGAVFWFMRRAKT